MASFLDRLRGSVSGAGSALQSLLLGQDPSEVRFTPEEEEAQRQRRAVAGRASARALGDVPLGEVTAAREAGREAAEDLTAATRSRVATARTPAARLAAAREGAGIEAAGRGQIARGVTQEIQRAEGQALRDALAASAGLSEEETRLAEERRRRARPGLLPVVGAIGGSRFGPQGAAIGTQLGSALTRNR